MAPINAIVRESVFLYERDGITPREVDILMEHKTADMAMSIAVECRARNRKDDIEWVDNLIGKYIDLPVDKIVAVSKSGLTAAAIKKAAAHKIEVRTLTQALRSNWPNEFFQLAMSKVVRYTRIEQVIIQTDPPTTRALQAEDSIVDDEGEVFGSLHDLVEDYYNRNFEPKINELTAERGLEIFGLIKDQDASLYITDGALIDNLSLIQDGDRRHRIISMGLKTASRFSFVAVELKDYLYHDMQVSTGTTTFDDLGVDVEITTLQRQGEDDIKLFTNTHLSNHLLC